MVRWLRPVVECVDDATFYYEAFAGGLALLWSFNSPFPTEVVSDRSAAVVAFWSVMKSDFDEFAEMAQKRGLHSEHLFKKRSGFCLAKKKRRARWSWRGRCGTPRRMRGRTMQRRTCSLDMRTTRRRSSGRGWTS